ncbi:MAG: hypothetical protein L0Z50_32745 [Verrucomicrobiales bacterium]|nr:hypothetical protein [Verrucomicrobiales bacterium]
MSYDAARGVVVLYGGFNGSAGSIVVKSNLWEWDGANWKLRVDIPRLLQ